MICTVCGTRKGKVYFETQDGRDFCENCWDEARYAPDSDLTFFTDYQTDLIQRMATGGKLTAFEKIKLWLAGLI